MRIRTASIDEAHRCAAIVARALLHDPVGVRAIRSRHDRLRRLTSLYEAELRLGAFMHGRVDVATVDDEIVGVDMAATLRQAPRYAHAVGIAHAVSAARALRRRQRARPGQSHWLLADIVVVEAARGAGVGAALLAHGLAACDGPVYLEATTASSRRLYERFGFTVRTHIGLVDGGYPLGMWCEPAPIAARG